MKRLLFNFLALRVVFCTMAMISLGVAAPTIVNPDFEDDQTSFAVATGWSQFGGYKWEGVWDSSRVWTQGVTDIEPAGHCGVYQTITVNPGTRYRISVLGRTQSPELRLSVGVDSSGNADGERAAFCQASTLQDWTVLSCEFTATREKATIFLRGQNTVSWWMSEKWCLFDSVTIEPIGGASPPPAIGLSTLSLSGSTVQGTAPVTQTFTVQNTGNDTLSYTVSDNADWVNTNITQGTSSGEVDSIEVSYATESLEPGTYQCVITIADPNAANSPQQVTVTLTITEKSTPPPSSDNLIANGDFSNGLVEWSVWVERGSMNEAVTADGELHLQSNNHNGGLYQQFQTGGPGRTISIAGFWASNPTVASSQWAEVLVINGARVPANGVDVNDKQDDVVLVYKNDTWTSSQGWSGTIDQTAAVINIGSFTSAENLATIILKSGNVGQDGPITGTVFDDIVVTATGDPIPQNQQPTAVIHAAPHAGTAPLLVVFDGADSNDPDGDVLIYSWDLDDGTTANTIQVSHTYENPGTYLAQLTVTDGRGGAHTQAVTITVQGQPHVPGKSKLTIHAGFGGPLSMAFVSNAKPRMVKILDSFSGAPEVKQVSPDTKIIGRAYLSEQPLHGSPIEQAQQWWEKSKHLVMEYKDVDYWEGYNEPIMSTVDLMRWYAALEVERVRILAAHGCKACIGNFSVGNPDIGNPDMWPAFYPAIAAAMENQGILGLHEYGTPMQQHFDVETGEGWFCGRYRKVYRQHLIPDGMVVPLAITECGVDVVQPIGWKNHFTADEYMDQLIWYDNLIKQDDYVQGATIYALEIPGWESFDIAPIIDPLIAHVAGNTGGQPSLAQTLSKHIPAAMGLNWVWQPSGICFSVAINEPADFQVTVFDAKGRQQWTFQKSHAAPGFHRVPWHAPLVPGIYAVLLSQKGAQRSESKILTQKLAILR